VNPLTNILRAVTRSPIVWGMLCTAAFYGLIHGNVLESPFIRRYFTGHPVEYGETVLFAIGLAALALRRLDVAAQYAALRRSPLAAWSAGQSAAESCRAMAEQLDRLPPHREEEYFVRRLRGAVNRVARLGSTQGLDDELKYLADLDASRAHSGYALFRLLVWAIPILGFLGTVIGITMALNGLDPKALEESMQKVVEGLGVKFDTTALALAMSMVLMFAHFFAERAENGLLQVVDRLVEKELADRFPSLPAGPDGDVQAMRQMAQTMVAASERLVAEQARIWQASLEAANARTARITESAGQQVTKALTAALGEALKTHAQQLAATEQAAAEKSRRHWDKLAETQVQNAQALHALQAGLTHQAEVLGRAVQASGEVTRLQDALNRNLSALAGGKHFEKAVEGLAATIHLLNARLAELPALAPSVQLEPFRRAA
jgi:biopolymer transport protein ExbB/TolQ